jgi:hypothetical protein
MQAQRSCQYRQESWVWKAIGTSDGVVMDGHDALLQGESHAIFTIRAKVDEEGRRMLMLLEGAALLLAQAAAEDGKPEEMEQPSHVAGGASWAVCC